MDEGRRRENRSRVEEVEEEMALQEEEEIEEKEE